MPGTKVRTSPAMVVTPDVGCYVSARCVTCPLRVHVQDLDSR